MIDGMLETGVDLAANNAINANIGKVEGMFGGGHAPAANAPAEAAPANDSGGGQS